jgi:hypothetical protein
MDVLKGAEIGLLGGSIGGRSSAPAASTTVLAGGHPLVIGVLTITARQQFVSKYFWTSPGRIAGSRPWPGTRVEQFWRLRRI